MTPQLTLIENSQLSAQGIKIDPQFLKAGKATFTVENDKGTHYTFRVKSRHSVDFGTSHYVYLGGENNATHEYLGVMHPETGLLKKTKGSQIYSSEMEKIFNVAAWALKKVFQKKAGLPEGSLPSGYKIRPNQRCGRCGKKITHPKSLDDLYGPECIKKVFG